MIVSLLGKGESQISKLSTEDKKMIVYFWRDKEDLTRWSEWEEKLPLIQKEYPLLIYSFYKYLSTVETMNAIVTRIEEEAWKEE